MICSIIYFLLINGRRSCALRRLASPYVEGSVPRDSAAKQKKPEKPGKAAKNRTRSSVAEEHDRVSR